MLQTTCECGRTMRANSEKDFLDQVVDHLRHRHPDQAEAFSTLNILERVELSAPRAPALRTWNSPVWNMRR